MTEPVFTIDGESFPVEVMSLTREFSIAQAMEDCVTMDGVCHREVLGTYYNYTMTLREGPYGDGLERFWQRISRAAEKLECTFPYGQDTLTQWMYVQSGSQPMLDVSQGNRWGSITIRFRGTTPQVHT